jgi:hypothetical protein
VKQLPNQRRAGLRRRGPKQENRKKRKRKKKPNLRNGFKKREQGRKIGFNKTPTGTSLLQPCRKAIQQGTTAKET